MNIGRIGKSVIQSLSTANAAAKALVSLSATIGGLCVLLAFGTGNAYAKTTPTLTVATSATPVNYGTTVTFTATISSGPTGTIKFFDGSTQIGTGTISSGIATYSTSSLTVGSHSITASWPGNTNYNTVTSSAITQTVNQATPTLTVTSSANPSTYGGSVKFTASISNSLTGTITFYDGSTSLGTGTLSSGKATLTTTALAAGSHSITASWPGNTNYTAVTSGVLTQTVNQATPTITWTSPSAITYGTALSSTQLNATASVPGTFSYSPASGAVLNAGTQTLSVTFTPTDSVDYTTASKNVSLTVNKATPTLTVASSGSPTVFGTAVTFTATISNGLSGTITFYDGSNSIGTGTISGSAATLTTSSLTVASHTITAKWVGNSNYNSVTSAGITQTISQATPQITWANPSSIVYGAALSATQLNATANVPGTFAYTPTAGTVLSPGAQALSTTFTPTDTTDYSTATATASITVVGFPTAGLISTIAGSGGYGSSGDGGQAINATFITVWGVAVDASGNLYIVDSQNSVVRKVSASTGIISTVAGNGSSGYSGDGGLATSAELAWPTGVAVDAAGDVFIADGNAVVREVSASTGIITTVAGDGGSWYSGDGGPATQASLGYTLNIALDSARNLYIADRYNMRIRKVSAATGIITTIAGNGTAGYTGDGGPATSAELNWPYGIAVDPVGNVYIADMDNNVVRKVDAATGIITTVAGNGTAGYSGDSGVATSGELNTPHDVSVDAAGNLFISDNGNSVIREVAAGTGIITTVAGNGTAGYAGDGGPATSAEISGPWDLATDAQGDIYVADDGNRRVRVVGSNTTEPSTTMPTITWSAPASVPYGTALGNTQLDATASVPGTFTYTPAAGTSFQAGEYALSVLFEPTDPSHYSPAMATVPITVTQVAPLITWPNPAPIVYGAALTASQLDATANVPGAFTYTPAAGSVLSPGSQTLTAAFAPSDTVDYTSAAKSVTLNVSGSPSAGLITTVAGNGYSGYTGDGGPAISAELKAPEGIAVDTAGNIYIPDSAANVVRKVTGSTGVITTIAGTGTQGSAGDGGQATSAQLNSPMAIAVDASGNVYVADYQNSRIRKISVSTGIMTTIAGTGTAGHSGDGGLATAAQINYPIGIAFDSAGNLYIADEGNSVIREVAASTGIITTVVGNGFPGYSGDGGSATSAELWDPSSIAFDSSGNMYIADSGNNVVRKVTISTGIISTVAGNGTGGYAGDGGPATSAELDCPVAISVDAAGNLYIVDYSNFVVRKVSPDGVITTVVGNGIRGYSGDGGPATSAELNYPHGVALDSAGNIYIGDCGNLVVREVGAQTVGPISVTVSPSSASLNASQQRQFTATVVNTSNTAVTWSISPSNAGSISSSGLYTAPASISTQQNVTITATSQADTTKSASATVTLVPAIAVSVSPATVSLYGGQTQAFSATVVNTSNNAVTWSISPSGAGGIDASGNYTAPATVTTQQAVTVTATSQADGTKTATATIYLLPPCVSNGYTYVRSIVIDHTKVPNTDQANFPFLFSTTDPAFKSTANGGHVASASGYDIIFSIDPAGQTRLDHEIEEYNPATGQLIAWVRIPTLSHTTDTLLYMFYGNANVTTSQQNPIGVWDSNYKGVYHLPNGSVLDAQDSTSNSDNGALSTDSPPSATTGEIDGGAYFTSSSEEYITMGNNLDISTQDFTIEYWLNAPNTNQYGPVVAKRNTSTFAQYQSGVGSVNSGGSPVPGKEIFFFGHDGSNALGYHTTNNVIDGSWHDVAITRSGTKILIYIDGSLATITQDSVGTDTAEDFSNPSNFNIGFDNGTSYYDGAADEVRISVGLARSADWFGTEYNNQRSPSTFYELAAESTISVSPAAVSLYAGQSQQFSAVLGCSLPADWSMPAGSVGTLSGDGLYTAPNAVSAPQKVTIIATSSTDSTKTGSAVVTLLPPPLSPTLTLSASVAPPYVTGASQQFVATLRYQDGTPINRVGVSFTVSGANGMSATGTTDRNGNAILTYTGTNNGIDSIQAAAIVDSLQLTSNAISVTWLVPVQTISSTTVTGRFFQSDNSGVFDLTASATPVFTQMFPNINFDGDDGPRPFTDVTTDVNGNVTGTIIAQGNGYQAGCPAIDQYVPDYCNSSQAGYMNSFEAVFTGSFLVTSPGNVTFNIFSDDSFILGIGNGATRVGGAAYNMPIVTPFQQYPAMGADNRTFQSPTDQIVVNFPTPGTYPYEVDYSECCGLGLGLVVTPTTSNANGVPPTTSLTLSPSTISAQPLGTNLAFTVQATDPSGSPAPNVNVTLQIFGTGNTGLSGITDSTGKVLFNLTDVYTNNVEVQAFGNVSGIPTMSSLVTVPPVLTALTGSNSGGSGTLTVSVSSANTVTLPNTLQLNGSAVDSSLPQGDAITISWSEVSGPATVSFANHSQPSTIATFTTPGNYVLQFSASDVNGSTSAQLTVTVSPENHQDGGWIGSPAYGAPISGIVPITVASGESLVGGTLTFYPTSNISDVTVLNSNTTGSGQIGTLDTTTLANGTYWITLQATDSTGDSEYNLALVTVVGNLKPGRVTSTVTDLVVPVNGLPIKIERTYDSLNANAAGDFGFGWNLSTNVDLSVSPRGDVTFTLGGIRRTFYLSPQPLGFIFPWYLLAYTPEPGFSGTLSDDGTGCSLDLLNPDGSLWVCLGGGFFNPSEYTYTDSSGTAYKISAAGNLESITDKNGNTQTLTANGITSSTGLSVPFTRDSGGRITQITDPQGNNYQYSYDSNGNLASVTYPNISQASTYTYDTHHLYLSGTDFRGDALPTTAYYGSSDTDPNGLPLNGRLKNVTDALGETTSYAYNLSTNTTTITYPPDANGNLGTATVVYDTSGDVLISTDPLGHTTTNTYDASLNLLSTTDPLGNATRYTYDSSGNKTSTTYPATATSTNTTSTTTYNQYSEPTQTMDELGNTRAFNYDVNFNPQSVTDGLGTLASFAFNTDGTMQSGAVGYDLGSQPALASQFVYDTNGNLASRTDALGRTTSYTYDSLGHKLTMTEPLPNSNTSTAAATTTCTYDDFGNLTQTSAPLGRVTSSVYDGNGNKTSDTDARGNQTTYQYDALNRLILTTYPDTTTSSKTYDFRGNVITETDQAGHVTKHVYDLAGRQTSVTHAYGTSNATTTSYSWDNDGRKLTETDALGHTTSYSYDAAGNLTGVSGVGGSFTYGYDNARNRVSMTDGNGHTTGYLYDARKRLIETDYPDSTKKVNAYDGPGNLTSVTDQAGNQVQYTYDAANQLKTVIQANSPNSPDNTTVVGYDADGNPIVLQDASLHVTASTFDLVNELTGKTLPDGSLTESRTYDNNGNLATVTHFNGVVTTYTYDTLNHLLSRATPGETTVGFTYTATGKRHTMTDASGTTTYSYDAMDRLAQKATPEGTLTYTYNSAGNLASMASNHTNGVSVSYTYDSLNRLSTVVDNRLSGSNTTTYTYDDASNVATVTYPNNVQTTFTYDELNRVTGLGSSLGNYSYQLGLTGNRTSALEPNGRSITWNYDGIYRLTNEAISSDPSGKNGSVGYGLDPVGNRTSASSSISGLAPVSGSFNADDHLSTETYDQNGNVLSEGGKTFTYDAENHLMSMGTTVGLMYDGDGNRVAKSVSGVTTYYLVDDLNPTGYAQVVEELSGSGAVTRQYTYGLQRISEQQAISNTWMASFYGYDAGGSVRALTNAAGAVTDTYDYDAFGNKINSTGTTPNNYLYRGEFFDSDLGLYYLRARWMNPLTGRFMSRDPEDGKPIDPKSLHKYLYADGDPVNGLDPTGRADAVEGAYADTIEIAFGHGARHLIGTGLSQAEVEAAIEAAVRELLAEGNVYGNFWGVINDFGIPIWYRAYFASAVLLNIGTYTIGH